MELVDGELGAEMAGVGVSSDEVLFFFFFPFFAFFLGCERWLVKEKTVVEGISSL